MKQRLMTILFVFILVAIASAANAAPAWKARITATYGDDSNSVIIGAATDATDGFENAYEARAILSGVLQTYFSHPEWGADTEYFWTDVRDTALPKEWVFYVYMQYSGRDVTLTWNLDVPDTVGLKLIDGSTGAEVDMKSHPSFTYTSDSSGPRMFTVAASGSLGPPAPPEDTTPPETQITSGQDVRTLSSTVTVSYDGSDDVTAGDSLEFSWRIDGGPWSEWGVGKTVDLTGLSDGEHVFYVKARDEAGNEDGTPAETSFTVDTTGPALSLKTPAPSILWPPDARMVDVRITGNADDGLSGIESLSYTVDDEYNRIGGAGSVTANADGGFTFTVRLKAARLGNDRTGRVYTVNVTAVDAAGNATTRSVRVFVPHDWKKPQ